MGIPGLPIYGTDLGSAIESAEKIIGKIKTNRFDKTDLDEFKASLLSVVCEIDKALADED